ncbi:MAG: hypothetical protein Q7R87_02195 [Nanoarchaeota archaeon]|nr:hypothetical protein [Nanoarchaeota archaeon]
MISLTSHSRPRYHERGLIGYMDMNADCQLMLNFHWFENLTLHNRESEYASRAIFEGRRLLIPAIDDSDVKHGREVKMNIEYRLINGAKDNTLQTQRRKAIIYRLTEDKVIAIPKAESNNSHTEIILSEREGLEIYSARKIIETQGLVKRFLLAAGGRDNAYFWEARDGILKSLGIDRTEKLERELPVNIHLEEPEIEGEEGHEIREITNEISINPLLKRHDLKKLKRITHRP